MKSLHQHNHVRKGLQGIFCFILINCSFTLLQAQGRVGINVDTPMAMLHVMDSAVLFSGVNGEPPDMPGPPPVTGEGVRMMWYPDKAAFRVGYASGSEWDKDSIGTYSFAAGGKTKATGWNAAAFGVESEARGYASFAAGLGSIAKNAYSIAMGNGALTGDQNAIALGPDASATGYGGIAIGNNCNASANGAVAIGSFSEAGGLVSISIGTHANSTGSWSTALGYYTLASGDYSIAMGDNAEASGTRSTAMGYNTDAIGTYSLAAGSFTKAKGTLATSLGSSTIANGYASLVVGLYNDTILAPQTNFSTITPFFIVGNGTSSVSRSNAMVVLKNGRTGLGTNTPANVLDIEGSLAVGTTFSGTLSAPTDGAIIQGQVGIGTNSPDNMLDVEGALAVGSTYSGSIVAPANGAIIQGIVGIGTSTPVNGLDVESGLAVGSAYSGSWSAPVNGAIIQGNVGIGTNLPMNSLDVENGLAVGSTYSGAITAPSNGAIIQGNVGIGTSAPERRLEVAGNNLQAVRITSLNNGRPALELQRLGAGQDWRIIDSTGLLFFGVSTDDLASVSEVLRLTSVGVTPAVDNSINLGSGSFRWTEVHAVNGTIQTSDAREKESITDLRQGLSAVMQLRPVSYNWKDPMIDNKKQHLGFIAQDLQQVVPEVVTSHHWTENTDATSRTWERSDRLGVNYSELIPVLTLAIQELEGQLTKTEARADQQNTVIDQQQVLIERLQERLKKIESALNSKS